MLLNMVGAGTAGDGFPQFTYTGQYQLIDDGKVNKKQNWRIKFLTSGTLTFTKAPGAIDVFLVGGGGSARYGGGGGGYTFTGLVNAQVKTAYTVTIGAGGTSSGNGGNTTAFGLTASGGKGTGAKNGAAGGSGGGGFRKGAGGSNGGNGGAGDEGSLGAGQGKTTREFGESTGTLYAGGGAGAYGTAGSGGGGTGASSYAAATCDGKVNTGGGGGGIEYSSNGVAKGGSGIAVIRNHRS